MRMKITLMLVLALGIVACVTPPDLGPPSGPNWPPYEGGALRIQVQMDSNLNRYEGKPHTIVLCIYQMRDPNAFNQLRQNQEGLYKLLECRRFDPSVTQAKRIEDLQPGDTSQFVLDRAEGTRFVGLVAGYFNMQPENMIQLYKVPISRHEVGSFSKTIVYQADPLNVSVFLGAEKMRPMEE